MKVKNYIIGLIFTLLFNTLIIENVAARMVFIKDDGATDADVFVIDADDSNTNDIQLQFGQTLAKTLRWDNLSGHFTFNDDLNIEGNITLTGTVDGVDISELATNVAAHTGSTANPHQVSLEQARSQNNQISGTIDFNQNQAQNLAIENLATAPLAPVNGQIYFNTSDNKTYLWDGSTWQDMLGGSVGSWTDSNIFTIDQDNNDTNVILSFGSGATAGTLSFDATNSWFNLNERLNIGGDGLMDGTKLTTTASATDNEQSQIEVRNNANNPVFTVDEDGDVTANTITSTQWHTKYLSLDIDGGLFSSVSRGTIAGWRSSVVRLDPSGWSRMRYSFPVPDDWIAGTDIIIEAYWTPSNTNTGNVGWTFEHAALGSGDIVNSTAFTTINATQAASGIDSQLTTTGTLFTIPNTNIASDGMINFRLNRNGAAAFDTFTGNVNIHMLKIRYTGKKVL